MEQRVRTPGNHVKDAERGPVPPDPLNNQGAEPAVDASLVRAQLERILASTPFRNSKRYPALLRYVVEQELNGAAAGLKERTIGMDVFGRDPSYDPGADPVVRISAGEVRKRLAQYYQEVADESQLRIELPLGSYHPEFVFPASARPPIPTLPESAPLGIHPANGVPSADNRQTVSRVFGALAILTLLVFLIGSLFRRRTGCTIDSTQSLAGQ